VLEGTVKPAKHHLSDAIKQAEADVAEIDNSPWSNKLVAARPGQTEEVMHNHLTFYIINTALYEVKFI
jgi:hypothetical protein